MDHNMLFQVGGQKIKTFPKKCRPPWLGD